MDLYSHVTSNMQKNVADKFENGIFDKLSNFDDKSIKGTAV